MVTQAGDPIPLTTPTFPPSIPSRAAATAGTEGGKQQDDGALTAAVEFLRNLPEPWAVGRVTAKAIAPSLIEVTAEQGWRLDEQLIDKLTENPGGINRHSSVLRIRINDLPKAPQAAAAKSGPLLPPWCGECGDGNPAAEFNAKWRKTAGGEKPCLACHPDTQTAAAA